MASTANTIHINFRCHQLFVLLFSTFPPLFAQTLCTYNFSSFGLRTEAGLYFMRASAGLLSIRFRFARFHSPICAALFAKHCAPEPMTCRMPWHFIWYARATLERVDIRYRVCVYMMKLSFYLFVAIIGKYLCSISIGRFFCSSCATCTASNPFDMWRILISFVHNSIHSVFSFWPRAPVRA